MSTEGGMTLIEKPGYGIYEMLKHTWGISGGWCLMDFSVDTRGRLLLFASAQPFKENIHFDML